jgi:branched-chain amino acid transport system permease protein
MEATSEGVSTGNKVKLVRIREFVAPCPLLSWLLGALVAVALEYYIGTPLARAMGLRKAPMLFGFVIMLKQPMLIPSALIYLVLIYLLPIIVVARLSAAGMNRLVAKLLEYPLMISVLIHLSILYAILHWWSNISLYRADVLRFTMIAVLLTLSLNLINGYMGEFSCSHPGFMALGAYASSVFTVGLFADDRLFGPALLPHWLGPFLFPVALIIGGLVASIGALAVAIPSFRTRGDYLAIISLAFMFIVKSLIENLEFVGGPRGLGDQPAWANRAVVFATLVLGIWIMNNFVRSTLGKALNAVRDNEMAADAMTVNTRQTKITAFLFGAFWAGVAGGLYAHALRYVNPGSFGIQKLAEVLAMVYFGGLNSVYGSIVGACSISLLGEMLRPLELFKWIIIPLLLILVMIFRPTGLIAFKEFDVKKLIQPKKID